MEPFTASVSTLGRHHQGRMMGLIIERTFPYICGLAAGLLWWRLQVPFPEAWKEFLASVLTLASIITGFLATAKAILMGLQGTQVMQDMHRSGYIADMVTYLGEAVFAAFLFCIYNLWGFFVDPNDIWYGIGWGTLGTVAAMAFMRVMMILLLVLRFASAEKH